MTPINDPTASGGGFSGDPAEALRPPSFKLPGTDVIVAYEDEVEAWVRAGRYGNGN